MMRCICAFEKNSFSEQNLFKVGDTLKAIVTPADADIESYSWKVNGNEVSTAATYTVGETDMGKSITVTITTKDGKSATSDPVVPSVAYAKLVDASGLQTDGTGLVGDTLKVTYTPELGNPKQVTWYRDGTAIRTQTAEAANGLTFAIGGANTNMAGNYVATITTGTGQNFTSNGISLVTDEVRAVMTEVSVADYLDEHSYNNGADLYQTFAEDDKKAVLTVKMNKYYEGKFYIFEAEVGNHDKTKAKLTINAEDVNLYGNTNTRTPANYDQKASTGALTDKAAIEDGDGAFYINENDGTVIYKFVTVAPGITRGTDYTLVFDQSNIKDDDTIASNDDVNISDEFTAPYLPEPKAIAFDSLNSYGQGSVVFYADEAGKETLQFLGDSNSALNFGDRADGTDAAITVKAYAATKKVTDPDDSAVSAGVAGTTVKGGKFDASCTVATNVGMFATAKTVKGVYGPKSVELTSDFRFLPIQAADKVTVKYDKKNPHDLKVALDGQATSGTIYLVHTTAAKSGKTNADDVVAAAVSGFDAKKASTYVGTPVHVERGVSEATFEGVVDSIKIDQRDDAYGAVYVPDNMDDFGPVATTQANDTENRTSGQPAVAPGAWSKKDTYCVVEQQITRYELNKKVETVSGNGISIIGIKGGAVTVVTGDADADLITIYDQFGEEIDKSGATSVEARSATVNKDSKTTQTTGAEVEIVINNGKTAVKIDLTGTQAATNPESAWTGTLSTGQTFTVTDKGKAAENVDFTIG